MDRPDRDADADAAPDPGADVARDADDLVDGGDPTDAEAQPTGRSRRGTVLVRTGVVLIAVVAVAALAAGWAAWRAHQAVVALTDARAEVNHLRASLANGDVAAARAQLPAVQADAARARDLTHDPVFRALGHVPYFGDTPAAVSGITSVTHDVAMTTLPALIDAADQLNPKTLRQHDRVDLARVAAAQSPLHAAGDELGTAVDRLDALPTSGAVGPVHAAVSKLRTELTQARDQVDQALSVTTLLPDLLGANGPRRYFLAMQTNAEARGTGGFLGAWGIVEADHGRVRVTQLASRSVLDNQRFSGPAVDLGADYRALYGDQPGLWANANLSPHFPYAARLWLAMYAKRTGEKLDGAIALDPVTLSYLLGATGPAVMPDGETVRANNVVSLTESDVYRRYPHNDTQRDAFLRDVALTAVSAAVSGQGNTTDMLHALGRAAGQRRLLIYSAHTDEEAQLAGTAIGGVVPEGSGPFVGLAIDNAGGNKLDYYLRTDLRYTASACTPDGHRTTAVDVTFDNSAPRGLPRYVDLRQDLPRVGPHHMFALGHGTNRLYAFVFATQGAQLVGATLDGRPVQVSTGQERGHPVFVVELTDPHGVTRLHLDLLEPAVNGPVSSFTTPLVKPTTVHADIPDCGVPAS